MCFEGGKLSICPTCHLGQGRIRHVASLEGRVKQVKMILKILTVNDTPLCVVLFFFNFKEAPVKITVFYVES